MGCSGDCSATRSDRHGTDRLRAHAHTRGRRPGAVVSEPRPRSGQVPAEPTQRPGDNRVPMPAPADDDPPRCTQVIARSSRQRPATGVLAPASLQVQVVRARQIDAGFGMAAKPDQIRLVIRPPQAPALQWLSGIRLGRGRSSRRHRSVILRACTRRWRGPRGRLRSAGEADLQVKDRVRRRSARATSSAPCLLAAGAVAIR